MKIETLGRGLVSALAAMLLAAGVAWADNHEPPKDTTNAEETTKAEDTAATIEAKHVVGDIVLGSEDAPVTIIEYASFTCPHCASFHANNWEQLNSEFIETGKVKFILREVYFDKYGLWAAMTARCGGEEGYYGMADTLLETQNTWTRAPDIAAAIQQIGRRAGLSAERIAACLGDREYAKALVEDYKTKATEDDVRSTPTILINGDKHTGDMPFEELSRLITEKLGS